MTICSRRAWTILAVACSTVLAPGGAARAAFTSVGVYDEAAFQPNQVDGNASGNPLSSTAITDAAGFTTAVAAAFAAGRGGVINFDNGSLDADRTFTATYNGGASVVTFTTNADMIISTVNPSSGTVTPISNNNAETTTDTGNVMQPDTAANGGAADFTISMAAGFNVQTIGFTINSRANASYPQNVTVTPTFSISGVGTPLVSNIGSTKGTDDTFYGFTAPLGESITAIAIDTASTGDNARVTIDDLGFIVPEPTGVGLLAAAALPLLARRRRRSR